MKNIFTIELVLVISLFAINTQASSWEEENRNYLIQVNPEVELNTSITILRNLDEPRGESVFAIHGFVHTAETYRPLNDFIQQSNELEDEVSQIIVLDFPNRGGSGLPQPESSHFQNLTLQDYVSIIIETLQATKEDGLDSNVIIAHSMGGLLTMLAQDRLIQEGSSLKRRFRIRKALIHAPSVPGNLPWELADSGAAESLLDITLNSSPETGLHISFPVELYIGLFMGNLAGVVSPGTPAPESISSLYKAVEPLNLTSQLISSSNRLSIQSEAIFANYRGTKLFTVSLSQDTSITPEEVKSVHDFLVGNNKGKRYVPIEDEFAVHDSYITSPQLFEEVLDRLF